MTLRDVFANWDLPSATYHYLAPQMFTTGTVFIVRPVRTVTKFPSVLRGMNNAVKLGIWEKLYANPTKDT